MVRKSVIAALFACLFLTGCVSHRPPVLDPNDSRLKDDLIDQPTVVVVVTLPPAGGPVVAPDKVTQVQTTNAPSSFGSEHYIWEDWDLQ